MKSERLSAGGLRVSAGGLTLYVDPAQSEKGMPKADIVLLTALDHQLLPMKAVRELSTPETIVVGHAPCVSQFRLNQLPIQPGQTREVLGIVMTAEDAGGGNLRYRLSCGKDTLDVPVS